LGARDPATIQRGRGEGERKEEGKRICEAPAGGGCRKKRVKPQAPGDRPRWEQLNKCRGREAEPGGLLDRGEENLRAGREGKRWKKRGEARGLSGRQGRNMANSHGIDRDKEKVETQKPTVGRNKADAMNQQSENGEKRDGSNSRIRGVAVKAKQKR